MLQLILLFRGRCVVSYHNLFFASLSCRFGGAILKLDGYTRMIVTHDPDKNILRRCTGLFTLKNGTVTEKGTFDSQMEKKGCFYSLFTVSRQ